MRRTRGMLILSLLSIFLGSTTVTSYAQSNSMTVEAGITFVEEGMIEENTDSTLPPSVIEKSPPGDSEGRLPQTGEQSSSTFTIIGFLCLSLLFYLVKRISTKER